MLPNLPMLSLEVIKRLTDDVELVDLRSDLYLIFIPLDAYEIELLRYEVVFLSNGIERVIDARPLGRWARGLQRPMLWRWRVSHECVGELNTCTTHVVNCRHHKERINFRFIPFYLINHLSHTISLLSPSNTLI